MTIRLNFHKDVKKFLESLDTESQAKIRRRLEMLRPDEEVPAAQGKYLQTTIRDTSPGITVLYQYRERQLMIYKIIIHPHPGSR